MTLDFIRKNNRY